MRVFLDTNVIASATATRGLCADLFRTVIEFHQLVISDHLLEEIKGRQGVVFKYITFDLINPVYSC